MPRDRRSTMGALRDEIAYDMRLAARTIRYTRKGAFGMNLSILTTALLAIVLALAISSQQPYSVTGGGPVGITPNSVTGGGPVGSGSS
jgi:hypothetical protein